MKTRTFHHKICIICGKDFTAMQQSAKTCSQSCRNALYFGRKLRDVPGVITPVITPVMTAKHKEIMASKLENMEENNSINNDSFNILTTSVFTEELKKQNICSQKGDIYCSLLYKYLVNLLNDSKGRKLNTEISLEKLREFGIYLKKTPAKISLGEFTLKPKIDMLSFLALPSTSYTVEKNQELSELIRHR